MRTRYRKILVAAAITALASMAILASVAQATPPAAPYQDFAGCPSPSENEEVANCLKYEFTGGHIQVGSKEIPVTNAFALRGGLTFFTAEWAANSEAGIAPVSQPVPGGLVGLTGDEQLDQLLNTNALRLSASVELAGTPGPFQGKNLDLPIKVHLENPLLGKACYIGSNSAPINLHLITGTTSPPPPAVPITGKDKNPFEPEASRPEVRNASDGIYVDNTYTTPGASGCSLKLGSYSFNIDELVDVAYHLPAAAGADSTILDFNVSLVSPSVVYP